MSSNENEDRLANYAFLENNNNAIPPPYYPTPTPYLPNMDFEEQQPRIVQNINSESMNHILPHHHQQTIADFKSNDLKSGIKSNLPDLQPELSHFQKPGIGLGF